ncbi:MAG: 1-phosphofructokinase [Clostridiaceae bacterium]|jgi:1-phosphofructokinase|nr:1-phosphofructokinase [Clostridiaceae bacterium]
MKASIVTVTMNPALDKMITVEDFNPGKLNRAKSIRIDPGGKGINVSKALSTYGVRQVATGILGGQVGSLISSMLKEYGIKQDFLFVSAQTRVNIKILDKSTGAITEVNELGPEINYETLEVFFNKLKRLVKNADMLVLAGSLPVSIPSCFYSTCIQMAEKMNVKTIIDTDGEVLKLSIQSKPYAIKPNVHELEQIAERPLESIEDIAAEARRLAKNGIRLVLVSLGRNGSILCCGDRIYKAEPLDVEVKSTVASGDAMVAALAYCIRTDSMPEAMVRIATAAGCLTASKEGSDMASWSEIKQSYRDIKVKEL